MERVVDLRIIHRNRIFRECLISVFSAIEEFTVGDLDPDGGDYLPAVERSNADVFLIDLDLSDNLAALLVEQIVDRGRAKAIVLVPPDADEKVIDSIAAGAHGCVLVESSVDELVAAVQKVAQGERFCSPEMIDSVYTHLGHLARVSRSRQHVQTTELSPRELEILRLVADQMANKQIAKQLSLSLYTVKSRP